MTPKNNIMYMQMHKPERNKSIRIINAVFSYCPPLSLHRVHVFFFFSVHIIPDILRLCPKAHRCRVKSVFYFVPIHSEKKKKTHTPKHNLSRGRTHGVYLDPDPVLLGSLTLPTVVFQNGSASGEFAAIKSVRQDPRWTISFSCLVSISVLHPQACKHLINTTKWAKRTWHRDIKNIDFGRLRTKFWWHLVKEQQGIARDDILPPLNMDDGPIALTNKEKVEECYLFF